ncbi:MAG: UDP-N-acetylmuramoyl-L-alanine--D-glutamate ligase [Acidimicrobiales bacterium]
MKATPRRPRPAVLVVGLGASAEAVSRRLVRDGHEVVVVEDAPGPETRRRAARLEDVEVVEKPAPRALAACVGRAELVVPSPGVPPRHPVFALASSMGVPVVGEIELASRWTSCPILAVTGTNGKTTVTGLITAMACADGRRAVAAGNIGLPLAEAVGWDPELLVVEVSSFQLALTETFHPYVSAWLNVAEDHLDWHQDFAGYVAAKSRIWANQGQGDHAVINMDDATVMAAAKGTGVRGSRSAGAAPIGDAGGLPDGVAMETFGIDADAAWTERGGRLVDPQGSVIVEVEALPRSFPHDLANALAASAVATSAGVGLEAVRTVLGGESGAAGATRLPHRVALVGDAGGVRWFDDSKATNPHAVLAALRGFDSVVLIAGGRNKGLSLAPLAAGVDRVRAVVAIGEAAPQVAQVFAGIRPVRTAETMAQAVLTASELARPGDAVLLSPGCASFDWYRSYAERGDDFAAAVRGLLGEDCNAN